jgi:hypothetical protein
MKPFMPYCPECKQRLRRRRAPDEPPDAGLEWARAVRDLVKRFGPKMVKTWVEFITEE